MTLKDDDGEQVERRKESIEHYTCCTMDWTYRCVIKFIVFLSDASVLYNQAVDVPQRLRALKIRGTHPVEVALVPHSVSLVSNRVFD